MINKRSTVYMALKAAADAKDLTLEIIDEETIVSRNAVVDEDGDRLANRTATNNAGGRLDTFYSPLFGKLNGTC